MNSRRDWRKALPAALLLLLTAAMLLAGGMLTSSADAAQPPVRRALVIGMSGYDDPKMRVPDDRTRADAVGVAEALQRVAGYVPPTLMPSDADTIGFMKVFSEFARTVDVGDQVLLFYSGHGVEFRGDAYLLLREAHADLAADKDDAVTKAALDRSAIKVRDLVERLQQSGAANIILVLNACRSATDAPLGQTLGPGDAAELGFDLPPPGRITGLNARDKTGVGTLFATSGNTYAEVCLGDCKQDKSPFTVFGRRFIETLERPNLKIADLVYEVGAAVQNDVSRHFPGRDQRVDWHDQTDFTLRGQIFLGPVDGAIQLPADTDEPVDPLPDPEPESTETANLGTSPEPVPVPTPIPADEKAYEASIEVGTCGAMNAFIDAFPTSYYANLAREKAAGLCAPPPSPPKETEAAPPKGRYFIILASFPHAQSSKAKSRVRELANKGIKATIIDTDAYSNLADGLYAVVLGPFSRSYALDALPRYKSIVGDAYVKSGS